MMSHFSSTFLCSTLDCSCCCSVAKLCPNLCDSRSCSWPGSSVLHYLPLSLDYFEASLRHHIISSVNISVHSKDKDWFQIQLYNVFKIFYFKILSLEYNCFAMFCLFRLCNEVDQLYVYTYTLPFEPPSYPHIPPL